MFYKLKITNADFSNNQELKDFYPEYIKNEKDKSFNDYIMIPEKEKYDIQSDFFIIHRNDLDSLFNNQNNVKSDFDNNNDYEINAYESNKMDIEYSKLGDDDDKKNEDDEEKYKNKNKLKQIISNKKEKDIPGEILKIFDNYDTKMEEYRPIENNEKEIEKDENKNSIKISWTKKENENKIRSIEGKLFQEQKLNIKKEVDRVIEKINKLDENKDFKYTKFTSREGNLIETTIPSNANLYENILLSDNAPIKKMIKTSEYLSNLIISQVSLMNLEEECPFKDLEVNILIDCARTISENEKFFTMLQVCGLTTALFYLEIPYLISIIGDSKFKIILKDFKELHNYLFKKL